MGEYVPGAPVNDEARERNGNLPGMGGVYNYVNLHTYHYAGNNPVVLSDPDGKKMVIDAKLQGIYDKYFRNTVVGKKIDKYSDTLLSIYGEVSRLLLLPYTGENLGKFDAGTFSVRIFDILDGVDERSELVYALVMAHELQHYIDFFEIDLPTDFATIKQVETNGFKAMFEIYGNGYKSASSMYEKGRWEKSMYNVLSYVSNEFGELLPLFNPRRSWERQSKEFHQKFDQAMNVYAQHEMSRLEGI
jgi:hypothetical protein